MPLNGGIDGNTVALYHFDGADASTTITDSSTGGSHTGTCAGNAQTMILLKRNSVLLLFSWMELEIM